MPECYLKSLSEAVPRNAKGGAKMQKYHHDTDGTFPDVRSRSQRIRDRLSNVLEPTVFAISSTPESNALPLGHGTRIRQIRWSLVCGQRLACKQKIWACHIISSI